MVAGGDAEAYTLGMNFHARTRASTALGKVLPADWDIGYVLPLALTRGEISPTPNFRWEEDFEARLVLLHSTQQATDNDAGPLWTLKDPTRANTVSAHLAIPHDMGRHAPPLIQLAPLNARTWHAGDSQWGRYGTMEGRTGPYPTLNNAAIGIELCLKAGEAPSPHQYAVLRETLSQIMGMFPHIGAEHVLAHSEVGLPAGRKTDPDTFDWKELSDHGLALPRPLAR
jgi:N-acetyl-anhydromuramyl-L-alanine amidase AmpD